MKPSSVLRNLDLLRKNPTAFPPDSMRRTCSPCSGVDVTGEPDWSVETRSRKYPAGRGIAGFSGAPPFSHRTADSTSTSPTLDASRERNSLTQSGHRSESTVLTCVSFPAATPQRPHEDMGLTLPDDLFDDRAAEQRVLRGIERPPEGLLERDVLMPGLVVALVEQCQRDGLHRAGGRERCGLSDRRRSGRRRSGLRGSESGLHGLELRREGLLDLHAGRMVGGLDGLVDLLLQGVPQLFDLLVPLRKRLLRHVEVLLQLRSRHIGHLSRPPESRC